MNTVSGDVIELAATLVRYKSISNEFGERECAEYLGGLLRNAGFHVRMDTFDGDRASLVALLGATNSRSDPPSICFTGHLDTVPLGSGRWSVDPFGGRLSDGRLYGRGASDMKSGVAAFVAAATKLAHEGEINTGLSLIITAGEETGCVGAKRLAAQSDMLPNAGALVIAEPTSNELRTGHKGVLWIRARTTGRTAHSSMPDQGDNAVLKACAAVDRLRKLPILDREDEQLGRATISVSSLHGGANINSVPDEATMELDIRTLPGQSHEDLRESVQECFPAGTEFECVLDLPAIVTDRNNEWVRQVYSIVQSEFGMQTDAHGVPYFTDGSILYSALNFVPCLILGPGSVHMAHKTDEYCLIDNIRKAQTMYERLILDWNARYC